MVGKYYFTCRLLFLCFTYHSLDNVKVHKFLYKLGLLNKLY